MTVYKCISVNHCLDHNISCAKNTTILGFLVICFQNLITFFLQNEKIRINYILKGRMIKANSETSIWSLKLLPCSNNILIEYKKILRNALFDFLIKFIVRLLLVLNTLAIFMISALNKGKLQFSYYMFLLFSMGITSYCE